MAGCASLSRPTMGYYGLEKADVLACIAYGVEMTWERMVEIPLEAQG